MVTFYSIIPSLRNELGHFFEYNLAFSKAAKINNYKHIKIIPKNAEIPLNDESWQKLIYGIDNEKKWKNIKNIIPFIKIFRKIKKEKNSVIFIEDFNLIVLILILIGAFLTLPKAQLWLFHRYEYDKTFLKGKGYKFIHFFFEMIFRKKNVKYLTDSELIKNMNEKFFKREFHVFPIPHIYFPEGMKVKKNEFKKFWWPGGLIREEKGLSNIKKILNKLKPTDNIKILIADIAKNLFSNDYIDFVNTNLSRNEYEKLMISSDLILLPYISELYKFRTSGIFVEAIMAGNIPVVSKNTWMSFELIKYNLEELILDWDSKKIIDQLKFIINDDSIRKKIIQMKECYKKIHSLENYALEIKKLINL